LSTDFTPARRAKKAAGPKVEICKQPTLIFHYDATLMVFSGVSWYQKAPWKASKESTTAFPLT
jgi:hypothetical protein